MAGGARVRRRLCGLVLLGAALAAPVGGSRGQELPASLIADQVTYDRETRILTASGNVEVLYQGRVLRAERIIYDEAANQIRAEGPLVLTDPAGGVMLAESAALTPDAAAAAGATTPSTTPSPAPALSAPRTPRQPGRCAPHA